MNKYTYYLDFLIKNGFSVLIKQDADATNNFFKCIKVRIFTLETIEVKTGKKIKGLFKDYFITVNINQTDYLTEAAEIMEGFCQNELKTKIK